MWTWLQTLPNNNYANSFYQVPVNPELGQKRIISVLEETSSVSRWGKAGFCVMPALHLANNVDGVSLPFFQPWRAAAWPLDRVPGPMPWCSASLLLAANIPVSSSHHHPSAAASPANLIRDTSFLTSSEGFLCIHTHSYSAIRLLTQLFPLASGHPWHYYPLTACRTKPARCPEHGPPVALQALLLGTHSFQLIFLLPSSFFIPAISKQARLPLGKLWLLDCTGHSS